MSVLLKWKHCVAMPLTEMGKRAKWNFVICVWRKIMKNHNVQDMIKYEKERETTKGDKRENIDHECEINWYNIQHKESQKVN